MTVTPAATSPKTSTRPRLFTPGPVEIPVRILRAMSGVQPHHRTDVFRAVFKKVTADLAWLHQTKGEVLIIAASGTGALEAAVVNFMAKGEKALVLVGGKFGERWANICKAYGVPYETIEVAWGHAIEPSEVAKRLAADPGITTVFGTQSETSTATVYDIQGIAKVTKAAGKRFIVDAITGVGVHPLPQDEWGVDVVITGSQKGLMSPPGLATVSIAPWAFDAIEGDKLPRFYWDLRKARKNLPAGESAWTPPVSLIFAVEEAIAMMQEEGLEQVHRRHARLGAAVRAGAQKLGWTLFSKSPANGVTAIEPPAGVDASATLKRLREVHGITVAGGQDDMKGKMIRIGHMGSYDLSDIYVVLGALEECTNALGHKATGAIEAARHAWEAV